MLLGMRYAGRMTRLALLVLLVVGCAEVQPTPDAGRDSGRPWDAGGDAMVVDAAPQLDAGLPFCLPCEDGGCVMRRQNYSEWTGLQCRDHSQAAFDADEAFFAASARLGCCLLGCCMEEPGCHSDPARYAEATTCAELDAMQRR